VADHVNHLKLGSWKDWQLMTVIMQRDYTFITNNRGDFLSLYARERLHPGLIIFVRNVTPARQCELVSAVLQHVGARSD
jgi:hypothetical protein